MLRLYCWKALYLFLILYPKEGDSKDVSPLPLYSWSYFTDKIGGRSAEDSSTAVGLLDGKKEKREELPHHSLLSHLKEPPSSLQELASRVTEILDRISRTWALEGAKTIQNGEIKLRKLHKDLTDKIDELLTNGSKHGHHVKRCMNKTMFDAGLDRILQDTTNCYAKSLEAVRWELRKVEEEENYVLQKMEGYAKAMYEMLMECFAKDSSIIVIECLQQVDGRNFGNEMRHKESINLMTEMSGVIDNIPRTFSECTSQGISQTEAHIRKGYAESLSCLKEQEGSLEKWIHI